MLKKKLCTILAAIMVTTTVLGSNIQTVGATVIDSESVLTVGEKVENGIYEVDNKVLKANSESESSMKNYIERKSTIKVEDSKITVTIKFNEAGTDVIKEVHGASVDGEAIELIKNEDGSISFIVPSIDSKINIDVTYEVKAMNWVHRTTFDLVNDTSSIPTVDDSVNDGGDVETPEIPEIPDNDNSNNDGNTDGEESKVLEDGTYTLNNSTYKVGTTQQSMARQFIEDKTVVTVKDGKIVMTLKYKGLGLTGIRNTNIKVNGVATNSTINEDKSVTFEVPTIDAKVEVEMDINVEAMGFSEVQSIDFVNDIDSLSKVDENESGSNGDPNKPGDESNSGSTGNEGSNNGTTGDSSNNGSTSNETTESNTTTTEEEKVTKGKLYSIKNNVTHESETGRTMARKYLNSTSKVEEIEGKYYVTLTFTGADFMQNHEIYVNGKKATVTKTTSGDSTNVRFAVSSLSDTIKVKTYVVPMSREVEFGVELLKDTLTLIKEYTVDTLPQTGAATSSVAVAGLGLLLTSAGAVLTRKRK